MEKYNPQAIEPKWQKVWDEQGVFAAEEDKAKKKFFGLIEFPYPSGDGLHTGHLRSNTAMDIICRKRRMQGYNVLYPIGFDAFGLPTENYAIKKKIKPQEATAKNIATFTKQLKEAGFSFDWSRSFSTTDEDYYKWTQWIFVQMFKRGLAEKKKETINWCTSCKIGLANEEVVNGVCERCGGEVVKKIKEQWVLKITKYADRLIKDLDTVDYLERIKTQQVNWIGKSVGAEIRFKIYDLRFKNEPLDELVVFTTRPDTLFGATFMVVAPEHQLISNFQDTISNFQEVKNYIEEAKKKSDLERTDLNKEKTGVEIKGIKAINPVNGQEIPIFVADYVMMGYGTGAIMAVPAHDERDYEFAKKYNISIKEVVAPLIKKETKDDKPTEKRDVVCAIVKDVKKNQILCLNWKKTGWKAFPMGGTDGENLIDAARREVREETGYKNIRFVKKIGEPFYQNFWRPHKDSNVFGKFETLFFELEDYEKDEVNEKEKEQHEAVWIDEDKVKEFINVSGPELIWQRYSGLDEKCFLGEGIAINSGEFNGLSTTEFKEKIVNWLKETVLGKKQIQYKLHDWIFSRQRYWGEPIPLIFCANCKKLAENPKSEIRNPKLNEGEILNPGWYVEENLPVVLPDIDDYLPTDEGDSPLAKKEDWVKTKCPVCGEEARRETDVMPNWAGSNWYFIRYTDPKNDQMMVDPAKAKYWLPVDWYNGGMEHTTLHLLYSRFVWKFLYDIGAVPKECGVEPYAKRTAHGMILGEGGVKMSKSKGNVINPDEYVKKYGADTLRVYEMFMGPFDQPIAWEDKSVNGVYRFLNRIWLLQDKLQAPSSKLQINSKSQIPNPKLVTLLHQTIKKVGEDIEEMKFNTAVAQMMILLNELEKQEEISATHYSLFIILLSPFAPHLAEELWQKLGHKESIQKENWPEYDVNLIKAEEFELVVQINGKVREKILVPAEIGEAEVKELTMKNEKVLKWLNGQEPKKIIYVKGKLVSMVI